MLLMYSRAGAVYSSGLVGVVGAAMNGQDGRVTVVHVRHDVDHDSRGLLSAFGAKCSSTRLAGSPSAYCPMLFTPRIGQRIASHLCADFR